MLIVLEVLAAGCYAGEMVLVVQTLGFEFDPLYPQKKPDVVACTWNPTDREEASSSLQLTSGLYTH